MHSNDSDQYRNQRTVFAQEFLFENGYLAGFGEVRDSFLICICPVWRRHFHPVQPPGLEVLVRIADHPQKFIVGVDDLAVLSRERDAHNVGITELLEGRVDFRHQTGRNHLAVGGFGKVGRGRGYNLSGHVSGTLD